MADEPRSISVPPAHPGASNNVGVAVAQIPGRLVGGKAINVTPIGVGIGFAIDLDISKLATTASGDPTQMWLAMWREGTPPSDVYRVPLTILTDSVSGEIAAIKVRLDAIDLELVSINLTLAEKLDIATFDTALIAINNNFTTVFDSITDIETALAGKPDDAPSDGATYGRKDAAWVAVPVLSDGDKGDITVSGTGLTWSVNDDIAPTWTAEHKWSSGGVSMTGAPGVDVPIAVNPWFISDSKTWQLNRVEAASATLPETGFQSVLTSDVGGANPHTAFKVGVFSVARGLVGTADVYGGNFVGELVSGVSSSISCIALEADINSHNADYGNTPGPISQPYMAALYIATGGTMKATAAQIVNCMGSNKFNRGIVFDLGTINMGTIEDWTISSATLIIGGSKAYGIDMSEAVISNSAIRMGNDQFLSWRNAADTADLNVIRMTSANNLEVDNITGGFIAVGANIAPITDNSKTLGAPSNRWTDIYLVNAPTVTSDPARKTDMQSLPDGMLDIVADIEPKTFRWLEGDVEFEEVEEEQLVQDETVEQVEVDAIEERGGKYYAVKRIEERRTPAYDVMPVLDENDEQVVKVHETKSGLVSVPQTHSVPRMVKRLVKVRKPVSREGRRTHWGFTADNIRDVMARTGRDFAGFVKAPDGTLGLRPDQLVPVLWKAVQEQTQEVRDLQKTVQELTAKVEQLGRGK